MVLLPSSWPATGIALGNVHITLTKFLNFLYLLLRLWNLWIVSIISKLKSSLTKLTTLLLGSGEEIIA